MTDTVYDIFGLTPNGVEVLLGQVTYPSINAEILLNWLSYDEEDLVELDDSAFRPIAFVALKYVEVE
jgi:hypothetical protein